MKVFQVERIVPNLVDRVPVEFTLADFELKNKNNLIDDQNDIYSSTKARQHKLEKNIPAVSIGREHRLQHFDLLAPGL